MNKSKVILIIQAVVMYLIHIPFYICLILARIPNINFDIFGVFILVGLCANLILIPVGIVAVAFAILNLTTDSKNPAWVTFIIKLVLIPWYCLNFLVCFLLVAGFLNPFLMLAVPLLIGIEVSITYIYMLCSSLQIVSYTIRQIIKKRIALTPMLIVGIVFSFIFVLDIVGSYFLYSELKKYSL
ncbi:MAG: hypothetical protein ACI4MQ_06770 [Candidatus Coproplasma sp.]